MARVRKPEPTMDALFFSSPEQKVIRFLLSEPTTSFIPRVVSSKLKGVRGLGGAEGITKILGDLEALGLVDFVDNRKSARLRDDNPLVSLLKSFCAACDLEGLKRLLDTVATRVILYGDRAEGKANSDSTYQIMAVSDRPDEVQHIVSGHPMAKMIECRVCTADEFHDFEKKNKPLFEKLKSGVVILGNAW